MTGKNRHGLGKGLDSIIPTRANVTVSDKKEISNVSRETLINITDIEPNREQPRRSFNEDSLQELAESIKQYGVVQPLIVQKKENHYELIAGERRWRAARICGLKQVPVIVKNYTDKEILEIALIENIQREDLNPIEEAHAYQRLISEYGMKQDEVAERVAKSRVAVTNSIRLLKLGDNVQQMLVEELISSGHARALLSITDKEKQSELATKVLDEKLSVRETEKLVKSTLNGKDKEKKKKNEVEDLVYKDLEEKVKSVLGTKVKIARKNKNKGTISLEYYSDDDLERIIELLLSVS